MQIAVGVPLVTVAGRAGHARISTTTDIYSHFLKSSDKTAAEKLEQLFEWHNTKGDDNNGHRPIYFSDGMCYTKEK